MRAASGVDHLASVRGLPKSARMGERPSIPRALVPPPTAFPPSGPLCERHTTRSSEGAEPGVLPRQKVAGEVIVQELAFKEELDNPTPESLHHRLEPREGDLDEGALFVTAT